MNFFIVIGGKEINRCLISIIIIKLIINLMSWYYYSCSVYNCFRTKNCFGAQFDKLEAV